MANIAWSPALHDVVKKLKRLEQGALERGLFPLESQQLREKEVEALKDSFSKKPGAQQSSVLSHWF